MYTRKDLELIVGIDSMSDDIIKETMTGVLKCKKAGLNKKFSFVDEVQFDKLVKEHSKEFLKELNAIK